MNNNYVTAATAARLKAAGFPQPEPVPGQFWYIEGALYIVRSHVPAGRHKDFMLSRLNSGYDAFVKEDRFSGLVFAPGVADLLRELGLEYDISTIGSHYIVIRRNEKDEILKDWVNDNPGEALAAAWLELHEKK